MYNSVGVLGLAAQEGALSLSLNQRSEPSNNNNSWNIWAPLPTTSRPSVPSPCSSDGNSSASTISSSGSSGLSAEVSQPSPPLSNSPLTAPGSSASSSPRSTSSLTCPTSSRPALPLQPPISFDMPPTAMPQQRGMAPMENSKQIANDLMNLFMVPRMPTQMPPSHQQPQYSHQGHQAHQSHRLPVGLGHGPAGLPYPISLPEPYPRACFDEFNLNGRESELDELDRLLRGLEIGESRHAIMSLPDDLPPSHDNDDVLTKTRLVEILRERERQKLARRRGMARKQGKVCVFCRNNGEAEATYTSHQLKDADGKITCPVLYIYTCPICGANGPNAHTIKYCPMNPSDPTGVSRSLRVGRRT